MISRTAWVALRLGLAYSLSHYYCEIGVQPLTQQQKATGARTETQALQPMLLPAYLSGGAAYSFAPVHG